MNKLPWDDVNDQFVIQVQTQIPYMLVILICVSRNAAESVQPVTPQSPKMFLNFEIYIKYVCSGARSLHGVCDGHSPRCLSLNQGGEQPGRERGMRLSTFSFLVEIVSLFSFARFYAWDLGMALSAVQRQHMFVEMECFRSVFFKGYFDVVG